MWLFPLKLWFFPLNIVILPEGTWWFPMFPTCFVAPPGDSNHGRLSLWQDRSVASPRRDGSSLQKSVFFVGHLIAFTIIDTYIWDHYDIINVICLVVWHRIFIFPYIGNTNPNWLIFFSEGLKPPTSYVYVNDIYYIIKYIQIYSNIIHIYTYVMLVICTIING